MEEPEVESRDGRRARVLAVADWSVDPHFIADALWIENDRAPAVFALLVPSRLPGLDWIGDPYASRPCARCQLESIARLADERGVLIEEATVGDPERLSAISASLEGWAVDRIMLFDRKRIVSSHPLSVSRRVARRTGRAVERVAVPPAQSGRRRFFQRAPRCVPASARSA